MTADPFHHICAAYDVPVLRVVRRGDRHTVHDIVIDTELDIDPAAAAGADSELIVRAVHALAAGHGAGEPEVYAQEIGRHCMQRMEAVRGARVEVRKRFWDRLAIGGRARDRDLVSPAAELRVARVHIDGDGERTAAGIRELFLLTSSPGPETRVVTVRLAALWTYGWPDVPYATQWQQVRRALSEAYAERDSGAPGALAQDLGRAVLDEAPPVTRIEISLEVGARQVVDMTTFGMENAGMVFGGAATARTVHTAVLRRSVIP
ncbi:urate oxidase [soil metagenome]